MMGWLRKIICIVLIVIAIMYGLIWLFPTLGELTLLAPVVALVGGNIGVAAVVALVGAAIVDPATVGDIANRVAEVAKTVGSAVGDVVAGTVSSVFGSFLSSPIGLAIVGLGLYVLLRKDKEDSSVADRYMNKKIDMIGGQQ